ncbi:MAG: hypothetical protein U0R19_31410 [Bryobacteraceae bacterium]
MIYELQAGALALPDIFSAVPPRILGLLLWVISAIICITSAFRGNSKHTPLALAAALYTGLFINLYTLVDEVSINLEHAYNLYHYGRFSMSPEAMVDGTVEYVYYLLHAPFAWSQTSLVAANFWISYLIGLLHLPLLAGVLDTDPRTRKGMLQTCAFALSAPLVIVFSSGFGNGLVSLVFLAAIHFAVKGKEWTSLRIGYLLPLLRPDAILLSFVNVAVIGIWRRLQNKKIFSSDLIPISPLVHAWLYCLTIKNTYGHLIPVPINFKSFTPSMLEMLNGLTLFTSILEYFSTASHALGLVLLVAVPLAHKKLSPRSLQLFLYAAGTLPLLLFYQFTHAMIGDFSFQTYTRYWIPFEVTLTLLILSVLGNLNWSWSASTEPHESYRGALILYLCATFPLLTGQAALSNRTGRIDGMFAGAFTDQYVPRNFTVATSEMSTFGLMLNRPLIDLWGYSTPAIAFSKTCNADHIRSNSEFFLATKPDLYWPYWFSTGHVKDHPVGDFVKGTYDTVEASLATFHHTSKRGNLLGDMNKVLDAYDVVLVKAETNTLAYLVRKEKRDTLLTALQNLGLKPTRQRPLDRALFHKLYDPQPLITYRCGT